MCVCVEKDLANRWTNIIFYSEAFLGPRKVYDYFRGGYHHLPREIASKIKYNPPPPNLFT